MKRQTWMLSLVTCLLLVPVISAVAQDFTDPSAWEQVIRGTGPFMEVTPNRVTITVPSASIDGELGQSAAFVRTACTVTGVFDVSVDFHLLTWPVGNGGRAGLNTEVSTASRVSFGGINGEVYFSTLGGVNIPTTDLNGSFRTTRSGGVLSAYYKDSATGIWVVMGSVAAPDTPLTMNLAVWAHRAQFTGADVVVAFDNFQVAEGEFPCFPAAVDHLTSLTPATLWLGLKNSDDQGTRFDVKTEVYLNDTLISEGLTRCITGVTRTASRALAVTVPFGPIMPHEVEADDLLSLKIRTRIGTNPDDSKCPGHNSAVGLRLYYDAQSRASGFGVEITPDPLTDVFLHSDGTDFLDALAPTAATAKFQDSSSLNFSRGNPWKEVGTWIMTIP